MTEFVPKFIDPLSLIKQQADRQGTTPIALLPRLCESLTAPDGEVRWQLHFRRQGNVAAITGSVTTELILQCQCCLERLIWPVEAPINLGVVTSLDEANLLPEPFEPLLLDTETQISLLDIVEDEVILALPIIPRHPQVCQAMPPPPDNIRQHPASNARRPVQRAEPGIAEQETDDPDGEHPFGVLAALLKPP